MDPDSKEHTFEFREVVCPKCGASHEMDPKDRRRDRSRPCPSCGGDLATFYVIPIRLILAVALPILAAVLVTMFWPR